MILHVKRSRLIGVLFALIISLIILVPFISGVYAQSGNEIESVGATVLEVEGSINDETNTQEITVELETGEVVTINQPFRPELGALEFRVGDGVIVDKSIIGSQTNYVITDFQRTNTLFFLVAIFVVLVIVIGRKKGFFSLISLTISYFLIIQVMLNQILDGANALFTAIWVSAILIPINYYLSHGFSRKTTYAAVSTLVTITMIGIFSVWIVTMSRLTGYTSDEAGFLLQLTGGAISTVDLLLAGIIVGTLGILDDITISQTSIANELKASKEEISFNELFVRTMRIGRDHIASLVNTLILVYTSASLPLLILLQRSNSSLLTTLNREVIMEEIVIMLLTSIALIIAVPISTYIACYFIGRFGAEEGDDHHHGHIH